MDEKRRRFWHEIIVGVGIWTVALIVLVIVLSFVGWM